MLRDARPLRLAFVKFGGLAAGGTEKALQTIAANLPTDDFEVTYFYCDAAPYVGSDWQHPDTDPARLAYMESRRVKLVKFHVGEKDVRSATHDWLDTDFWSLFDETAYDILQTARAGHPEYPFTRILNIPQVDLLTLPGMAERKPNVEHVVHVSRYQARAWIRAGGEPELVTIIPLFDEAPANAFARDLRDDLGIPRESVVFGMHQRTDDGIFSPLPLDAYARVESDSTFFLMLGGSERYTDEAARLRLKHFRQLPHTAEPAVLHAFLETLDVFAHGRSDGETYSLAIAEALQHGRPVVSHAAPAMGHVETIGDAGVVVRGRRGYVRALRRLERRDDRYRKLAAAARTRYERELSLEVNMPKWIELYRAIGDRLGIARSADREPTSSK